MKTILFFFLVMFSGFLCSAAGCKFPSSVSCLSPDKKWVLKCKSSMEKDGSYLHVLTLNAQGTTKDAKEVEVYRFDRSCDALWSTNGHYLALTDWLGSNVSEILIVAAKTPFQTKPISEIVGNMGPFLSKEEREGHIYYEAMEWLDEGKLRIKVFGHTNVAPYNDFEHQFICDLVKGRFAPIARKVQSDK
jgi:hypothetical protein